MTITDVIGIIVVVLALGGAIAYIVRAKKKGAHCIGCPSSGCCSGANMVEEQDGKGACSCELSESK